MLLEFESAGSTEGERRMCWINPEYVICVGSGTDPIIYLQGNQGIGIGVKGDGKVIAQRIQRAMADSPIFKQQQESIRLGDHIHCVFCNEYYGIDLSQPPKPCPKCGKLQEDWKKEIAL